MENNYRNMMDEVKAPESLRGSVMNISQQERTGKTRSTPMRALMVAACICVLLVTVAVAAEMAGIWVSDVLVGEDFPWIDPPDNPEDYSGYIVTRNVEGFSWDNVSAELKAEAEKMQEDSYTAYFSSQAELEATLGFTLPDNPVLDAAQESKGHYQPAESEEVIHIFGRLWILLGKDGKVHSLHVWTDYVVSNPEHVAHKIYLPISEEERENGVVSRYYTCKGEVSVTVEYEGQESKAYTHHYGYKDFELTREDYVTPNGVQTVIIREDSKTPALVDFDKGCQSYTAHLVVDGMALTIHASGNENCADVKGVLKSILDAYQ